MKVMVMIVALATLMLSARGALRQCAGIGPDNNDGSGVVYESSGFLTADWTQKACAASGGSIDPNKKGNQKCCNVPDSRLDAFDRTCLGQKAENFPNFSPNYQSC